MKKYFALFLRKFTVEIDADDIQAAQVKARAVVDQFSEGTCKLHSIKAEDYVEPTDEPVGPKGKPPTGPTPGTPALPSVEIVEAQAKVA